jgi:tetratricopeptide (TPR) repeat protein
MVYYSSRKGWSMKQGIFFLIIIFLLGGILGAETLYVEYLEGTLEIKKGKSWIELFTDDMINADAVIRLSPKSLVELTGENTSITLMKEGVYQLADLIKETETMDSYGLDNMISMKLKTIVEETGAGQESNMGIRAKEVEDYIGDKIIEDLYKLADAELKKGSYDNAIRLFTNAIEAAETTDPWAPSIQMFHYYIGYCYFQKGEETKALSRLMNIDVDNDAPYYTDYVLLYGKLLMKSFAYDDALVLFNKFLSGKKSEESPVLQDIYYLISLCHINLDTEADALTYLKKAKKLDPSSEVGKKAEDIIKILEK